MKRDFFFASLSRETAIQECQEAKFKVIVSPLLLGNHVLKRCLDLKNNINARCEVIIYLTV